MEQRILDNNKLRTLQQHVVTSPALTEKGNGSCTEQVMLHYQESLLQMANNFLQAQQQVMLAYLNNRVATTIGAVRSKTQLMVEPVVYAPRRQAAGKIKPLDQLRDAPVSESVSSEGSGDCKGLASVLPVEALDRENLVSTFIDLVSQRTGYPVEMLDPTLDLESDLGIDSIKRVEILSNFRRVLPEGMIGELESGIEDLAGVRTLQGICEWIRKIPER